MSSVKSQLAGLSLCSLVPVLANSAIILMSRSLSTKITPPLPTEDIHSPAPHPARGIYGFALYIASWVAFIVYLIWAFVPTTVLTGLGITYVPSKFWAILVPLLLPTLAWSFVIVIFCINLYRFRGYGIFDDVQEVENDFGERAGFQGLPAEEARYQLIQKCCAHQLFPKVMLKCMKLVVICRYASRASLREFQKNSIKFGSRGSQVPEIQRRIAEYERMQLVTEKKSSQFSVDSLMSEKLLKDDPAYAAVLERRVEEKQECLVEEKKLAEEKSHVAFPLDMTIVDAKSAQNYDSSEDSTKLGADQFAGDRGFYMEAGRYIDEYVAGNTADIPDDESSHMSTRVIFGSEDAVEQIDFQLPGQKTSEDDDAMPESEDVLEWSENFGSVDPDRKASKIPCDGCGAPIHCKNSSLPGFLPVEVFDKLEKKKYNTKSTLCRRCHLLKNHNFLLNVNVCPVDYESMMSHLKMKEEALIIMVVDVTDLSGSINSQLPRIIGSRKPMIVVGNKIDLLPPDARCGYLKRFKITVEKAVEDARLRDKFNILHTGLISAKTGYGVEDLITEIHLKYTNVKHGLRSDMYLIGCTNAGKSTLFNALLQSDLCKVRAVDLVERAATSVWPGTTISLLKFPVMKPSPYRLEMRRRRLMKQRAWNQKEMYSRKLLLQQTGESQYAVLTGVIQNTYKDDEDELQPLAIKSVVHGNESDQDKESSRRSMLSDSDPLFSNGAWCFDTPGTVNDQQVTNLFTLEELVKVLPRKLILPRTALIQPGHSLMIGGVGRIDVEHLEKQRSVLLTTFVSEDLPLTVLPSEDAEEFYDKFVGTPAFVVPQGDANRMQKWPGLSAMSLEAQGVQVGGAADVVISSVGWVMVTSDDAHIRLKAWSPGGKGIAMRDPILPHYASLRGKRISGTYFYQTRPIDFPVNRLRQTAHRKKRNFN